MGKNTPLIRENSVKMRRNDLRISKHIYVTDSDSRLTQ